MDELLRGESYASASEAARVITEMGAGEALDDRWEVEDWLRHLELPAELPMARETLARLVQGIRKEYGLRSPTTLADRDEARSHRDAAKAQREAACLSPEREKTPHRHWREEVVAAREQKCHHDGEERQLR